MQKEHNSLSPNDTTSSHQVSPEKCTFCRRISDASSLYTCPKCNIRYCSLNCCRHKDHLQCSEAFYKSSVEEELKCRTASAGAERDDFKKPNVIVEQMKKLQAQAEDEIVDEIGKRNAKESEAVEEAEDVTGDHDEDQSEEAFEHAAQASLPQSEAAMRQALQNADIDNMSEEELDEQLRQLGIGTDIGSLLSALSVAEAGSFDSLANEYGAQMDDSCDIGKSVFKKQKT